MANNFFRFQQFTVYQDKCGMKVGTDGTLLGAWATGGRRILDIGTGTGLIALMMAQRFPEATVTAIDIDADASAQARENVASSPFTGRIDVAHVSLQDLEEKPFPRICSSTRLFATHRFSIILLAALTIRGIRLGMPTRCPSPLCSIASDGCLAQTGYSLPSYRQTVCRLSTVLRVWRGSQRTENVL